MSSCLFMLLLISLASQVYDEDIYWIYQIQLGFYLSLVFTMVVQKNALFAGSQKVN